jgi:hypothetical protein
VLSTNAKCTRGCGCSRHPAFPTPSMGREIFYTTRALCVARSRTRIWNCFLKIKSGICIGGGALPLPLWERVGVRGRGLSMGLNPSPGSHLSMQRSRSFASASFSKNGRRRRPMLSHKGRGDAEHLGPFATNEATKRPRLTLLLWIALAECPELWPLALQTGTVTCVGEALTSRTMVQAVLCKPFY